MSAGRRSRPHGRYAARPLAYGHATATKIFLGVSGPFTGANDRESLWRDPPGSEGARGRCCDQCGEDHGEDGPAAVGVRPNRLRVARGAGAPVVVARSNRNRGRRSPRFPRDGRPRAAHRRRHRTAGRQAANDDERCASALVRARCGSGRRRDCREAVRAHHGARRTSHPHGRLDAAPCLVGRIVVEPGGVSAVGPAPASSTDPGATGGVTAAGLSGTADGGGEGSGAGCGAGGASGAGGGREARRGGRRVSGSTYNSAGPTRTPRWTYGAPCSASPVGPGSARTASSETTSPRRTCSVPRWVSETFASRTAIVTVRPFVGTAPANVTSPATGARIGADPSSATSIPRC